MKLFDKNAVSALVNFMHATLLFLLCLFLYLFVCLPHWALVEVIHC